MLNVSGEEVHIAISRAIGECFYSAFIIVGLSAPHLLREIKFYKERRWNLREDSGQSVFLTSLLTNRTTISVGRAKLSLLSIFLSSGLYYAFIGAYLLFVTFTHAQ